ncbi:MAG: hypothetical protein HY234_05730 [Acidobacteria bacterium]|nr:hypothetical protein [Acidobacteriota bacterium]MBI3662536.1 hypothetical protein [Acidobacteriota bacterium]
MRRSEAARYARWAVTSAALLALTVAGVYAYRSFEAARARRNAPPVVPPAVRKQSAEFSFSKVEQDRTLFTVRASRTTEYKAGGLAQLQDVWITIYGRFGKRFDNIHTRECDYAPATGEITCAGEVQIDLESAEEAKQRPGERVIHVGTVNVTFDRESGELHTENPVVFRFPYGHGRGVGVTYSTRDAKFTVHRDVELTLTSSGKEGKTPEPVVLTGAGLEYQRDSRTMRLLAPVRVKQGERLLTAGALALEFDAALRARRLVAGGNPQYQSSETRGQLAVTAQEIVTLFGREGSIERLQAAGNVTGRLKNAAGEDRLQSQRAEVEMEPGRNLAKSLTANGNVSLDAQHRGGTRRLETQLLRIALGPGRKRAERRIELAESLAPATLEIRNGEESTRVRGERLAAQFDERNVVHHLTGSNGVEVERRLGNRPPQVTSSRDLAMRFSAEGEWTEVEQSGSVRFREGDRNAQADRARMVRAADAVTLTGSAAVADGVSRTTAPSISFNQRTGEIRAEGGVRTSYFSAERNSVTNLAPQPAHLSADQLLANRSTGRAVYSGHARLWQGDAVIEAAAITLLRDEQRLEAGENVLALLPQAPNPAAGVAQRNIWRARAAHMTYWSSEGRVRMEGDASAQSSVGHIQSRTLELYLTSANNGPKQLSKALATGGVTVQQRGRRGTAEHAEYLADEGKIVLSGGRPTLYDSILGTTSGRQLTFFLADDKILVDSEEGSRTLSRHRVEK